MESSCGQNSGYAFYKSVSVVFFESNHFSVVFQVLGDTFQQVQFFHCVVEASEFFMEFPCRFVVFVHGFHLLLGRMGGSSSFFGFHAAIFRYWGERRRLRKTEKNRFGCLWVAFNLLPSVCYIVRLKRQSTIKGLLSTHKTRTVNATLTYSENAF